MGFLPSGVSAHNQLTDKEDNGLIDHANESVKDSKLFNIEAFRRQLAYRKHLVLDAIPDTVTGLTGQDNCYSLAYDGRYIYAGLKILGAMVLKIDPIAKTIVSFWYDADKDYVVGLTHDGSYLYAAIATDGYVVKIDTSTMTTVAETTTEFTNTCIAYDGTYLIVGSGADDQYGYVTRITPSDMTKYDGWAVGDVDTKYRAVRSIIIYPENSMIYWVAVDGDAGDGLDNAIRAYDVGGNLTSTNTPTPALGSVKSLVDMVTDGYYVYVAIDTNPPALLRLTYGGTELFTVLSDFVSMRKVTYDGKNILVSVMYSDPDPYNGNLLEFDQNLTKVDEYSGIGCIGAIMFDGKYLWCSGGDVSPMELNRLIPSNALITTPASAFTIPVDETENRTVNTIYRNTSGHYKTVIVTFERNPSINWDAQAKMGESSPTEFLVSAVPLDGLASTYTSLIMVVPPLWYYEIVQGVEVPQEQTSWIEYYHEAESGGG